MISELRGRGKCSPLSLSLSVFLFLVLPRRAALDSLSLPSSSLSAEAVEFVE